MFVCLKARMMCLSWPGTYSWSNVSWIYASQYERCNSGYSVQQSFFFPDLLGLCKMFICYFLSRPEKKKEGIKSLLQHPVNVVALLFAGRFAQQPAVSVHQRRDSCMAITSPEAGSRCEAQGNKKWIIFVC